MIGLFCFVLAVLKRNEFRLNRFGDSARRRTAAIPLGSGRRQYRAGRVHGRTTPVAARAGTANAAEESSGGSDWGTLRSVERGPPYAPGLPCRPTLRQFGALGFTAPATRLFPSDPPAAVSSPCRPTRPKISGNTRGITGFRTASSNPTTTSSTIAASPGTNSSSSHGSCPSAFAIGFMGSDHWDSV